MQNNLKAIRLKRGLTQKQVAEKLGLKCEDRLSHWERGSAMPSVRNLMRLAEVYKKPPQILFENSTLLK